MWQKATLPILWICVCLCVRTVCTCYEGFPPWRRFALTAHEEEVMGLKQIGGRRVGGRGGGESWCSSNSEVTLIFDLLQWMKRSESSCNRELEGERNAGLKTKWGREKKTNMGATDIRNNTRDKTCSLFILRTFEQSNGGKLWFITASIVLPLLCDHNFERHRM